MGQRVGSFSLMIVGFFLAAMPAGYALSVVPFTAYSFDHLVYDNRIAVSGDLNNGEFSSSGAIDSNGDGMIDALEAQAFGLSGPAATVYVGNRSNGYDIAWFLMSIAISGPVDSFTVNDVVVTSESFAAAADPAVYFIDDGLRESFDFAVLCAVTYPLPDREPNGSPIGENAPYVCSITDVAVHDTGPVRLLVSAYGAIQSGVINSYSPLTAQVLFVPTARQAPDDGPAMPVVPEPSTGALFLITLLYQLKKRRKQ